MRLTQTFCCVCVLNIAATLAITFSCKRGEFYSYSYGSCRKCPENCANCNSTDMCMACKTGYKGVVCEHACSNCANGTHCHQHDGYCVHNCSEGLSGYNCSVKCDPSCKSCDRFFNRNCFSCAHDRFGRHCKEICSVACKHNTCNDTDGGCTFGCSDGYWGTNCTYNCSHCEENACAEKRECLKSTNQTSNGKKDSLELTFIGLFITLPIFAIIIFVIICLRIKRNTFRQGMEVSGPDAVLKTTQLSGAVRGKDCCKQSAGPSAPVNPIPSRIPGKDDTTQLTINKDANNAISTIHDNAYEMIEVNLEEARVQDFPEDRPRRLIQSNVESRKEENKRKNKGVDSSLSVCVCCRTVTCNQTQDEIKDENSVFIYASYFEHQDLSDKNKTNIDVDKLADYVKKKTTKDFHFEFEHLSLELIKTDADSSHEEHIKEDGYNERDFYNLTPIVFKGGYTDNISACFIDGYKQKRAYISFVGPSMNYECTCEIWRFVWQQKCSKIVMFGNPSEAQSVTYDRHVPAKEMSGLDGIDVRCENEINYATYAVKTLKLQLQTEIRKLVFFNYTAWPKQRKPDVVELVAFRNDVNNISYEGPTLVYCSSGEERIGTYIAFDILTKEGATEGRVDIFHCVKDLREQKAGLMQSGDQYEYLHRVLVCSMTIYTKLADISRRELDNNQYEQCQNDTSDYISPV